MTNPIHIALVVNDLDDSIRDYSQRFQAEPVCVVPDTYALWRTSVVNFSISVELGETATSLRHLGVEDPDASVMSEEKDCNGITWERFTPEQQRQETLERWPDSQYDKVLPSKAKS